MTTIRIQPGKLTLPMHRGFMESLSELSRHMRCPEAGAVSAALAILIYQSSGRRRVGVKLGAGNTTHEYIFDIEDGMTIRDVLSQHSLNTSRDADLWVGAWMTEADKNSDEPVLLTVDAGDGLPLGEEQARTFLLSLVEAAVQQPDRAIGTLSLLNPEQRRHVLTAWNQTERPYPQDINVCQLFEDQASRTPHAIAIVDGERAVSYADLNARADQLAATLRRMDVGPGSLVGLHLNRSAEMLAALLGVLKAGAAYVPLDPSYPPARICYMLLDSQTRLVLSEMDQAGALQGFEDRILLLGGDGPGPHNPRLTSAPPCPAEARDLAYVIYTSGSTGKPKGVQIEHAGVVNFLLAMVELIGLDSHSAMVALTSLSFDIAVLELLGPLVVGGRVIMASHEQARDGEQLARLLSTSGATVMQATPSTWNMLLAASPEVPPITALCGGEAMQPSLARRLVRSVRRLWNVYGPTETTIWSTAAEIGPEDCDRPPVGKPIANTRTYILDDDMEPVPVGYIGELFIGGAGVARGYLHRPQLTMERFVPDPFADDGSRLFRTGDLARFRPDGMLELLGRRDHQVKIRGHRVELGEVETVLASAPAVAQVVVELIDSGDGSNQMEAFVVLTAPDVSSEDLRAYLADRLPAYMIPTRIKRLEQMPLLPNGKVDRSALPRGGLAQARPSASEHQPMSSLERRVAAIWGEVLDVPSVQAHDDFFLSLGGNSLHAGAIMRRLEQTTGETVFVTAIFNTPTLQEFCAYLEAEYPRLSAALTEVSPEPASSHTRKTSRDRRIDASMLRAFSEIVTGPQPALQVETKNPKAAFVLSAPRSGSTLLRVMLAGNPRLFSPPELELLGFDTMDERTSALTGSYRYARDGVLRAVRELLSCDAKTAETYVQEHERGISVAAFYRLLQELIGDHLLVEKTTTYAMDAATLQRAELFFDEPLYVHLVRHPAAMILSYEQAKLDQIFRHSHPFSRRELAELIWIASNQNVSSFFDTIPPHRRLQVRFEDLLARPAAELTRIAEFLGVPFSEAMLDPYGDPRSRMVDGLHLESRMAGDFKFPRFRRIETDVAYAWRDHFDLDSLSMVTTAIARTYGYLDCKSAGAFHVDGALDPR